MTLSLATSWLDRARAGAQTCFYFEIDMDGGTTLHRAMKGYTSDATLAGYPASLISMTPVNGAFDVWSREQQVTSVSCVFAADGWMKGVMVASRLKGKKATIKAGFHELALADYAPVFVGTVGEIKPHSDGAIEMKIEGAEAILRDKKITGAWGNEHPLGILSGIMTKAGVPAALYDAASLDPTNAAYTSTISHWNTVRGFSDDGYNGLETGIVDPTDALEVTQSLCELLGGQFVTREDGKYTFILFDKAATADDTWTNDDFLEGSFKIQSLDERTVNRMTVEWKHLGDSDAAMSLTQNETGSQAALIWPGESERVYSETIKTPWLEAVALNATTMTAGSPGVGGTFVLESYSLYGFCGVRWPSFSSGAAQPASAQASSTRKVYVKIQNDGYVAGFEIIECDLVTVDAVSTNRKYVDIIDPTTGAGVRHTMPYAATFRVLTRAALGTTAAAHAIGNPAYDATIPAAVCSNRLDRFKYGVPIVKVRTSLAKYAYQLGDTIALTTDQYSAYGVSTLTTDTTWEVIGKQCTWEGDDIGIEWTLAWANYTSAPSSTYTRTIGGPGLRYTDRSVYDQTTFKPFVAAGLVVSAGAGLTVDITAGVIYIGNRSKDIRVATAQVVVASKDNYVYVDTFTTGIVVKAVALGAAEPTRTNNLLVLAKVVTGAASVSSVTDMRNTSEGIQGSKVVQLSIGTTALADGAATTAKLADVAVTAAKIGALAVTTPKINTGAVTATEIATAAVTTLKVAPDAVTAYSVSKDQILGKNITPNGFFQHWSRG